ncbi:hypothetical protein ES707_05418 [subsurface metagenome]
MNIIIYTTPKTLLHKKDTNYICFYWSLLSFPKHVEEGDKIYFAAKGFIRGYFEIDEVDKPEIQWQPETWTAIKPIPCKPFQGFKYFFKEQ